jgi:hypothetical protein
VYILRKGDIVDMDIQCGKPLAHFVIDKKGSWVNFEESKEFLKTPTNSAMDTIALAARFIAGDPEDVSRRNIMHSFVRWVGQQ